MVGVRTKERRGWRSKSGSGRASIVAALVGWSLTVACSGGHARYAAGAADADTEGEGASGVVVDILLLVDTSCEAAPMQQELARGLGVVIRELQDPTPDSAAGDVAPPVVDLHVGMRTMSADMAGFVYYGCEDPELGALVLGSAGSGLVT